MYYVATVAAHYLKLERYIYGFFWVYKKRNLGLKLEKFSLEILDFQAEWLEKRNWDLRNLWSVNKYGVSIFGISLKNYSFSLSAGARMAHRRGLLQRRWLMGVGLGERPFFFSFFFYHDIWIIIHCGKIILFVVHFKITSSQNCLPWADFLSSSHGRSTLLNVSSVYQITTKIFNMFLNQ